MTTVSAGSLCWFLSSACVRAADGLPDGPARRRIEDVRGRLSDNVLRIAVAGRLNAGKSTLVNALLQQELSPTDATESTKIVTWFRHGNVDQTLLFADGGELPPLPGCDITGALAWAQQSLDDTIGPVTRIEVRSSNGILRHYAIVDTPGLDSTSDFDARSIDALREADVLIFVTPQPSSEDGIAFARLRDAVPWLPALGVLSRIDESGNGRDDDPWQTARRNADDSQHQLGANVSMVIPVIGLLGKTALADGFTETKDMPPLRRLHEYELTDPSAVERYTALDFAEGKAHPLSAEEGDRLVRLLGRHGIAAALRELRSGKTGAQELLDALLPVSGVDVLLAQLRLQFLSVADPLRARDAIRKLDEVAWQPADPSESKALARLRDDLAVAAADPRFLLLDIVDNLTAYATAKWQGAGTDPTDELTCLVTGTSTTAKLGLPDRTPVDQVQKALIERIGKWRTVEGDGDLETARRARAVREYLEALHAAATSRVPW
jgi:hypothetical protein